MINPVPVVLKRGSIRLEPTSEEHIPALQEAAADGALWSFGILWFRRPMRQRPTLPQLCAVSRTAKCFPGWCVTSDQAPSSAARGIMTLSAN
jgi:hypothetical protein